MIAKILLSMEVLVAVVTATSAIWAYRTDGIDSAADVSIAGVFAILVISSLFSIALARNK